MKALRLTAADIMAIGTGGALGSLLRTWVGLGFDGLFPAPTLLINLLGSAALAVLHSSQHRLHPRGHYLYMVGFCGSFTTVSLFSYETISLLQREEFLLALANVSSSIVLALLLVCWIVSRLDIPRGKAAS